MSKSISLVCAGLLDIEIPPNAIQQTDAVLRLALPLGIPVELFPRRFEARMTPGEQRGDIGGQIRMPGE